MQAYSVTFLKDPYDGVMKTGRPSNRPRTAFGERLHVAREALGLSQAHVATKFGITQKAYAVWERYPVALRPDQVEKLAEILHTSVEDLFGKKNKNGRNGGPIGKARRVFEEVSKLPRSQQQHVLMVVEAFVAQQAHARGTGT
mgnify:CR=1 FL=1